MTLITRLLGCFCALALLAGTLDAQTLHEYRKSARKLLAEGDSVAALGIYRQAFENVDRTLDASARMEMGALAESLKYYTIAKQQYAVVAADSSVADKFPDLRLKLAEAQRRTGAYEAAEANYRLVLATAKDSSVVQRARAGIADAAWAMSRVTRMDSVEVVQLPAVVNTNNSEFGASIVDDRFYFSRLELRDYRNRDLGTKTTVRSLDDYLIDSLSTRVELHPGQYVAHLAVNPDRTRAYFTVCEAIDLADFRCDIYRTGFGESGPESTGAEKLAGTINTPNYTQTNPTVGRDPQTGEDLLVFASNRPGGAGKMDLWMSRIAADGTAGPAENLTALNTAEDDVTPFFHVGTQSLFFSSKGHETLGGFDIHRSRYADGDWSPVTGLRAPINSTFDDTYYSLNDSPARTYFASNRPGATCEASEIQECCGFDVYSVDIAIELEVLAFDALDSTALAQTNIVLYDVETGNEVARFTDASNLANFPVELGRAYRLVASREGYGNDTLDFNTKDIYQPTLIRKDMYLPPMLELEVYTFNAISREPLNGVRVTFSEVGTADTTTRVERAGNKFTFPVLFGREYALRGTRSGFTPDASLVSTRGFGGTGRVIRDTLYLKPFSPLPLVLYFDNDYPNPNTTEPTTTLTYSETVPGYLAREPKFVEQGTRGAGTATPAEMRAFFDEVEANHAKLLEFSGLLVKYLREGNEIDIIIEGYASPLAQSDYNEALTSRRTRSIINHFIGWESGALLPYLQTGQLRIKQEPLGEKAAPKDISDSPRNRRLSEYGIKASRERRVRLIDIQRREGEPLSGTPASLPIELQNTSR